MLKKVFYLLLISCVFINTTNQSKIKRSDIDPVEDDHEQSKYTAYPYMSNYNGDKSTFDNKQNASLYFDMANYPEFQHFKQYSQSSSEPKQKSRNERALDLDVLLGDKSQRQFTGTRQSRILSDDDKSKPNLAIQGFIPILSIGANHQPEKSDKDKNKTPQKYDLDTNNNEQINAYAGQTESGYAGPQDAKFIGAALQNLAGKITGKPKRKYGQDYGGQQQGDCVCVPFYMCKKGFLESSTAKNFQNNLNGFQNNQYNEQQGYETAFANAQINHQTNLNQYYPSESQASSQEYPLVDERSIDGSSKKNKNESTPEYVSEILSKITGRSSDSLIGGCGVLRTCCKVMPEYQIADMENIGSPYGQQYPPNPIASQFPNANLPFQNTHIPSQPNINLPFLRPQLSRPELSLPSFPIESIPNYQPSVKPISSLFGYANPMEKIFKRNKKPQPQAYPMPPLHIPQQFQPNYPQIPHIPQEQNFKPQYNKPMIYNNYPSSSSPVSSISRSSTCGKRDAFGVQGRVLNLQYHESSTEFGEYPWQIAILKRLGPADSLFVCGGALISDQWVVTAAHCIKKNGPQDLKVRLGEWDVHREDEYYPYTEKFIEQIIVHPQFVPGTLLNDIALIKLDSPVQNSQHISPVCLPDIGDRFVGQRCWVTGWGKNSFGQQGQYQSVLREVDVPVLDKGHCENLLRKTRLGPYYQLHPGFICAGGERGKDACEGDGGSALVCDVNGSWKAVGLVSWGIGCGQQGVPGVYVNMAHYINWIDSIIDKFGRRNEQVYNTAFDNSMINERSNSNSNYNETIIDNKEKDGRSLKLDRYSIKNFENLNVKKNSTDSKSE